MHLLLNAPVMQMLWRLGAPNVMAIVIRTSAMIADAWLVGLMVSSIGMPLCVLLVPAWRRNGMA